MSFNLYYQQYLMVFLLCFGRNLSLIYFFYITNKLAMTFKTAFAIVLSAISFYLTPLFLTTWDNFLRLLVLNITIGFVIAFVISIPFYLIQMTGSLVDNFRGETVGATLNSSFIATQSSMYNLLNIAFFTYFICCNGLFLFMKILFLSYSIFPLNAPPTMLLLSKSIVILQHLMLWFGMITFPTVCVSLLIDIIFAFSAVVVPNLNTFFLGFPIKSMGIILLYFFLMPTLFFYMMRYFNILVSHLGF